MMLFHSYIFLLFSAPSASLRYIFLPSPSPLFPLPPFPPDMQSHRPHHHQHISHFFVPHSPHHPHKLLRPVKPRHRLRQIPVSRRIPRNHSANHRQDFPAIKPVQISNHSRRRLRKFQNRQRPARLQHPPNLPQSLFIIRQ